MHRRFYAWGYKTRTAALDAMLDEMSSGRMDESSQPEVCAYTTRDGRRLYGVSEEVFYA